MQDNTGGCVLPVEAKKTGPTIAEPVEQKVGLPSLDKGVASFFDDEQKAYWVGIPIGKTDFLTSMVILDSVKFELLGYYQKVAMEQQNKKKILNPWEQAKANAKNLIKKVIH